ncbi:putative aminotransferase [Halobacteriovorax marinus SJ]|uniref:Aminotransferase n=1 Tax=Halobacteriovorax marinus (strain ATCC BAA-682 / DSM 15412 / SJ) TaxID=862908 RepID=E1X228_HALMS|nr:aminotransferase class III-fold pyridoxal phosphate-dependent enzyme [Halobacteriovorax marinus]CBW26688.1 putative aminotransferase [Halobacteriovorax marinus SJ]
MKLPIIGKETEEHSKARLANSYANNLIPPEKKNYLTDLKKSTGPFLAITDHNDETKYLMDAASQIATLGLGFSPSVFFGAAHYLSSWTNDSNSKEFHSIRKALTETLKRKTNWPKLDLTICNSGAEANEIALGYCYKKRVNKNANKVLAFEGSFHGRMMITLSSTWNKVKREPFEWPGHETIYCTFPELETDLIHQSAPKDWRSFWASSCALELEIPKDWNKDSQIEKEINSLLEVREKIKTKEIFAILIEPMQCEGGDRYSSGRFNEALILMARSFGIPVIFDEVQTGFHLGKEFFWHKEFNLRDDQDKELYPDYVVCAKKAQVGLVLSHNEETKKEELQVSSVIRGYLHAVALDQSQDLIHNLEKSARVLLDDLCKKFEGKITRPRVNGMAFAFELPSAEITTEFINRRFDHGLLYYPAGAKTLRFRLNTSFTKGDIEFLFERLDQMAGEILNNEGPKPIKEIETRDRNLASIYEWQELLLLTKLKVLTGEKLDNEMFQEKIYSLFEKSTGHKIIRIDKENFSKWKDKIHQMQLDIYEPTRQTEIEKFEYCATSEKGQAVGIIQGDKLLAMSFSSPLSLNPFERGVRNDPDFNNPNALYMVDSTVGKELQGKGVGRFVKYALSAFALNDGIELINGRNRDRMAASMLSINLSLGAHEIMYMREDYPDFEKYRNVLYYTSATKFKTDQLSLSDAINSPLSNLDLTAENLSEQLPYLVNKVCLSNFVSPRFLDHLDSIKKYLPESLQHLYTTSGQSECVDKLAKSIWYNQEEKTNHMITFKGHYFGSGSFLSRSLSNSEDKFFDVTHLDHPNASNEQNVLQDLERVLKEKKTMAIWLEPIGSQTMERIERETLTKIIGLASKYGTKVIFNETAASFYRYDKENFLCSNIEGITPDAAMCFLGGQSGLCYMKEENFLAKPLMLISTWDGDEFALSNFHQALEIVHSDFEKFTEIRLEFTNKLLEALSNFEITEMELENGCGHFKGNISLSLARYFKKVGDRYLVIPSFSAMREFLGKE